MIICNNCGVELDDGIITCPLCGKNPGNSFVSGEMPVSSPSQIILLHKKETRKHLWELSGILAFSGMAVCTIVELTINQRLEWSLISDVSLLSIWLVITIVMYFRKRIISATAGIMITVLAALFVIDQVAGGRSWFFQVALPVTTAVFVASGIIMALYKAFYFRGLNLIAAAFFVLAGFCIITEIILDKFEYGTVDLRWSLITGVSILPIALLLLFYHYRLKKGNRLDSFFHV